jgi:hypothetical protein
MKTRAMKRCRIHIREGRSLARHQERVAALPCPVLRLDGSWPLPGLVAEVRMTHGKS